MAIRPISELTKIANDSQRNTFTKKIDILFNICEKDLVNTAKMGKTRFTLNKDLSEYLGNAIFDNYFLGVSYIAENYKVIIEGTYSLNEYKKPENFSIDIVWGYDTIPTPRNCKLTEITRKDV
jgi:hypothetical protein